MVEKLNFVYGEESFLIEQCVTDLKKSVPDATVETLAPDADWEALNQAITGMSLFDTNKVFVWRHPWLITSALEKKDMDALKAVIEALNESEHVLIVHTDKKVDQRKKGVSFLKKNAGFVKKFDQFKDWEQDKMINWLSSYVSQKGAAIDDKALYALVDLGGKNCRHLAGEIDKAMVFLGDKTHITLETVLSICSGVNKGIYDFNEAMKKGNLKQIMTELTSLLNHGEDPIKLMGLVTANIRFYYQLLSMEKKASFQAIAKALGKNPYFVKLLLPEIKRGYTLEQCTALYHRLADTDLAIKSGKCAPKTALELVFLQGY